MLSITKFQRFHFSKIHGIIRRTQISHSFETMLNLPSLAKYSQTFTLTCGKYSVFDSLRLEFVFLETIRFFNTTIRSIKIIYKEIRKNLFKVPDS